MTQQNNDSPKLPYSSGLDGLRAIAVLAVIFYHLNFPWALGGYLGVETFILISGYLITSLLLEDYRANGRINLKEFWLRRIRRLWPALWLLLAGVLALGYTLAPQSIQRLREDVPAAIFYFTNWLYILRDIPYFERHASPPLLQHLWSLAMEEQFYLLWPLLLWAGLRLWKVRKGAFPTKGWLIFPSALATLSAGWMVYIMFTTGDTARAYYGTDTRAAGFLLGGALAVLWPLARPKLLRPRGKIVAALGGGLGAVGLLLLYTRAHEFVPWLYPWGFLLTDLFTALLIAATVNNEQGWGRILGHPVLRWIGTRSYGIYLWHWPLVALFRPGAECRWPGWLCALGHITLTFLLAEWSYRMVENPIRRGGLSAWWQELRVKTWRLVGFPILLLCVAGFVSWRPWTNEAASPFQTMSATSAPQSEYMETTETPLAYQPLTRNTPEPTASASPIPDQPTSATDFPLTFTATPELSPTPSPTPRWTCFVTLIGDSVMARTDSTWMAQNSIYYQFWVKALPNRQTQDILLLLQDLRKSGHLYHTVVLHTGSNGLYSASTLNDIVAQMSNLGVRKIYMLNVRVPMGWERLVNDHIAEVAQNWPELVVLVDWHEISGGHPEWFLDDGVHLTKDGAQAYVDITLDTIRRDGCAP
jgi:peptidoglycan/LPS O-acetylase OafA/YrhL